MTQCNVAKSHISCCLLLQRESQDRSLDWSIGDILMRQNTDRMTIRKMRLLECLGWFVLGCSLQWLSFAAYFRNGGDAQHEMYQPNGASSVVYKTSKKNNHKGPHGSRHDKKNGDHRKDKKKRNSLLRSSTDNSSYPFHTPIKFVFFIGLEGTGHHFMSTLLHHSPMKTLLKELQLDQAKDSIQHKLFDKALDGSRDTGLWDAHCNNNSIDTVRLAERLVRRIRRVRNEVKRLVEMDKVPNKDQRVLLFPINTLWNNAGFGMVSYPNFGGWKAYRFLTYPNLDLWYQVCNAAEVDCDHIYLYRNPLQILRSTVIKRHYNPNMMLAIHLYKTMLHVVASQLETHRERTLACLGFFETSTNWMEDIRRLFWLGVERNQTALAEYNAFIGRVYQPSSPVNVSSMKLSSDHESYVENLQTLHNRVVDLCQTSLFQNNQTQPHGSTAG